MGRLSAEQIAARRLGIGSSDVAGVLGLSPYRGCTPLALWLEMGAVALVAWLVGCWIFNRLRETLVEAL